MAASEDGVVNRAVTVTADGSGNQLLALFSDSPDRGFGQTMEIML